jgi:hypothetical protein
MREWCLAPIVLVVLQISTPACAQQSAAAPTPPAGLSSRLSLQMTVSIPFDPSMSDSDRAASMTQSQNILRAIFNKQCEIYTASSDAACRVGLIIVNDNLPMRARAPQLVAGKAEFVLTSPAAGAQNQPKP